MTEVIAVGEKPRYTRESPPITTSNREGHPRERYEKRCGGKHHSQDRERLTECRSSKEHPRDPHLERHEAPAQDPPAGYRADPIRPARQPFETQEGCVERAPGQKGPR